ncbi:MAG: DUF3429 domain-containing protein [Salinarimonadaceae bacterium]|nr:MAG: DUF3429 domain-containing protein [Salinarimonadaceae bacterium]
MTAQNAIPRTPLVLGAAGLAPFWILALALVTGLTAGYPQESVQFALVAYGAVILSFTGGIRWGVAVLAPEQDAARREYVISVVPSLLAWAVLLLPAGAQIGALAILTIAAGLLDYGMACRETAPEWFGRLRLILAGAAGAALVLVWIAG